MKVSVILPVYNGEKHLIPCLESLVKQTIDEYEVICVDDGSKDRSGQLLDEYQKRYPEMFKVFHKENEGVYKAREYGLERACGDYVGFCDCDDVIAERMYELLYTAAVREEAEMSVCAYTRVDGDTEKVLCCEMNQFGNQTISVEKRKDQLAVINTALWNKLIQREVALKHICFEKAPRVAEDMMFLLSLYPYMTRIVFCDEPLYQYYVRSGSAMSYVKPEEIAHLKECMVQTRIAVEEQKGKDWRAVSSMFAFIHFGIAFVLKSSGAKGKEMVAVQKDIEQWLSEEFVGWNKNPYLRCGYVFGGHAYLLKPMIVMWMYKMKLFPLFLKVYVWVTETLKMDIKW